MYAEESTSLKPEIKTEELEVLSPPAPKQLKYDSKILLPVKKEESKSSTYVNIKSEIEDIKTEMEDIKTEIKDVKTEVEDTKTEPVDEEYIKTEEIKIEAEEIQDAASQEDFKNTVIYQFKISLSRKKPKIWRRVQVPGNYNFRNLHLAIQRSMGWKSVFFDYHLHAFEMVNPATKVKDAIVMPDDVELHGGLISGEVKNEEHTKIADYFTSPGHRARYEYDFGMSWIHDVVLEKTFMSQPGENYPKCVAGQKACPPEDGCLASDEEYDSDEFNPTLCFQSDNQ